MSGRRRFAVGDRVRLTGDFLRWTGQIAGEEGGKRWCVVACGCRSCADGFTVATDEPLDDPGADRRDLNRPRHVAASNLQRVRA